MENMALRRCRLFGGLEDAALERVLAQMQGRQTDYPRGGCILRTGEPVPWLGVLLTGSAVIVREDFWGNRNLMAKLELGELFGESFACTGEAASVTVLAEEQSRVLLLPVERVLNSGQAEITRNLIGELASKNLRFNEKLTHMGKRTTREKLLSYLSAQARRQGSSAFEIPFSRQQLADYLGVERSAMSAQLGHMRREGLIDCHRSWFHLLKRD